MNHFTKPLQVLIKVSDGAVGWGEIIRAKAMHKQKKKINNHNNNFITGNFITWVSASLLIYKHLLAFTSAPRSPPQRQRTASIGVIKVSFKSNKLVLFWWTWFAGSIMKWFPTEAQMRVKHESCWCFRLILLFISFPNAAATLAQETLFILKSRSARRGRWQAI